MSRLIDADALNAAMYHEAFETDTDMQKWDSGCWIRYQMFERAVKAAPTIEAEPVRHGHWIWDDNGMDWNIGAWKCSICRCENANLGNRKNIVTSRFAGSKYCPHCGAKMDEVSE